MRLNPTQRAQARRHAYTLFSRIYMEGVTPPLLPHVQAVPELAAALPSLFDVEDAAVDYQTILGQNVFPYQSVFLDPKGVLGGPETSRMLNFYETVGFDMDIGADPDHIGQQFMCLAFLCGAEANAWEGGSTAVAQEMRQFQTDLLQYHLCRWLLAFTFALKREGNSFYQALADLVLDLVAVHAQDLVDYLKAGDNLDLPQPPNLLADKNITWKEISHFILCPGHSGIYVSQTYIEGLARKFNLSRGFGERQQLLTNLFQSALIYDSFSQLMTALQMLTAEWREHYQVHGQTFPGDIALAAQWQERTVKTMQLFTTLKKVLGDE